MNIEYFNSQNPLNSEEKEILVEFLFRELGQYGDPAYQIGQAIDYAMDENTCKGGVVAVMYEADQIVCSAVVIFTGMKEFIPENLLVYIAVSNNYRGRGFGKRMLSAIIERTDGDFALHVEEDNPAVKLYRSMGFDQKYLEMRLSRKE